MDGPGKKPYDGAATITAADMRLLDAWHILVLSARGTLAGRQMNFHPECWNNWHFECTVCP